MKWIQEPGGPHGQPVSVLLVEHSEPMAAGWAEYWKRILIDGARLAPASRVGLAIDIYARTFAQDSTGQATAKFRNSLHRDPEGMGHYALRSEHFTFFQEKGEDDQAFGAKELPWLLDHYKAMKASLHDADVWPLCQRLNASQPLAIRGATINGWFDLQAGREGFGTLPMADQELLAGMKPTWGESLEQLAAGVFSAPPDNALEELSAALIHYTPPHFRNIQCTIQESTENGLRALFYRIECPEFPDDSTTVVNDRVHRAATLLVQQLAPEPGSFRGLRIELSQQADGEWQRSVGY